MTSQIDKYLFNSYEASRASFRARLPELQSRWPAAKLHSHYVDGDEDLSIEWIDCPPLASSSKLLVVTTGEHGIEGFIGSAVLQLLLDRFVPLFDQREVGLLLVHPINPWGMKHRRRTNAHNVDLNRNFWYSGHPPANGTNGDYIKLRPLLCPSGAVRRQPRRDMAYLAKLLRSLILVGMDSLKTATLAGQYQDSMGIMYGGSDIQEETQVMMDLFRDHLPGYQQILVVDVHSGFGERYTMSLVNSRAEPRASAVLAERFGYENVVASDSEEFYGMHGDMIDWLYKYVATDLASVSFFATCFEFATLGLTLSASVRSLRAAVLENQAHWYGVVGEHTAESVRSQYEALFCPPETEWWRNALTLADKALNGILGAEGFIAAAAV